MVSSPASLLAFAAILQYQGVAKAAFSPTSSKVLFGRTSISKTTTTTTTTRTTTTSSPLQRYSSVSSILDGNIPAITMRPNLMPISSDSDADAAAASVDITNDESSSMDSTSLGTLTVPSVGIGTISWSSDKLFGIENAELQNLVDMAVTRNAAFFDTAERYGSHLKTALGLGWGETEQLTRLLLERAQQKDNEAATRPIVVNHRQEQVENNNMKQHRLEPVVATKFTPSPWRTTVQSVIDACEESRRRLGVEQIDLYQIHMPDIVQPFRIFGKQDVKDEIYWEGLAECYHRGLVKNVGVCNYGPTLLTKCHEALAKRGVPLASNQIAYSLIGRHNGAQETVDKCNELGVKVLAFYPFAMGLLTGKYSSKDGTHTTGTDDKTSLLVSKKTRFEVDDLVRYAKGDGQKLGGIAPLLSVMEQIAKSRNKTVAQVALNYIVCKGAIPIPGARTQEQLRDNIGAMGWRLSDTEVAMLEQTADLLGFGFDGAGFKRTSEKFVGYGVEKWALD